jgi:hypothetical protein
VRRILVVGCGGSGGATLAYLMDQLRSDLATHGIDQLPTGWQFVHIDVPSTSGTGPDGLGSVQEQGGTYFGCGPQAVQYSVLDNAVSGRFAQKAALDAIGTWAPREPERVTTPISAGAGQYRAVGRMISLSRVSAIRDTLQAACDRLNHPDTITELRRLRVPLLGNYDDNTPIVLVVSSMAGGAGASMALDVCRVLAQIRTLDPKLAGVFLVAPNIFDKLPAAARTGVGPNALAMLGEIVASQTGAARRHDVAALQALGQPGGAEVSIPFARVFPVGRFVGIQGTQFGEGTPAAVYRGLGRGLAALVMSGKALGAFVEFDLATTLSPEGERDLLGWGCDWDPLPWGSFGFASLSMGRDRYAEYAAQRMARSCVDRLLTGHLQPGNQASANEQTDALLDSQWVVLCRRAGLPTSAGEVDSWMREYAFPTADVGLEAQAVTKDLLEPYLPDPTGVQAQQWLTALNHRLAARAPDLAAAAEAAAGRMAFMWHRRLLDLVEREVSLTVAGLGLPYAVAVVERLQRHVRDVIAPGADQLAGRPQIVTVAPELQTMLARLRGAIGNGRQIMNNLVTGCRDNVHGYVHACVAELTGALLRQFSVDVLKPLAEALSEAQLILEQAMEAEAEDLGLARLATDQCAAWPSDDDEQVADRFDEADNEVLLTSSEDFQEQYVSDLRRAAPTRQPGDPVASFADARARVAYAVVSGTWKTTGGTRSPGGLLSRTAEWRPRAFAVDPATGEPLIPSLARYDVQVRPKDVLARARMFVERPGESFDQFCRLSITDFVTGAGVAESEGLGRRRELVEKFRQALTMALPLISVNNLALQAVHTTDVEYRYKFSDVPFRGQIATELIQVLTMDSKIDQASVANLRGAIADTAGVTRIDIFGSYPNYSPLVFDAVLKPVAEQWAEIDDRGRESWWRWRRARPLDAALPMGDEERRAMVAGWFLGLLIGRVSIPAPPYTQPVRIWDGGEEAPGWVPFPHPLLTPPRRFHGPNDWLPAVLESVLVAIARSHEAPVMSSLRPYRLLRGIYDDSHQMPAAGPLIQLSAGRLVAEWLASGITGGGRSAVPGAGDAGTVDERAKLAVDWLDEIRRLAGEHYMAPDEVDGALGGGQFSVISTRKKASATPMFRDIAPDVFWATGELVRLLESQRAAAHQAGTEGADRDGPPEDPDVPTVPGVVF